MYAVGCKLWRSCRTCKKVRIRRSCITFTVSLSLPTRNFASVKSTTGQQAAAQSKHVPLKFAKFRFPFPRFCLLLLQEGRSPVDISAGAFTKYEAPRMVASDSGNPFRAFAWCLNHRRYLLTHIITQLSRVGDRSGRAGSNMMFLWQFIAGHAHCL